MTKSTRPSSPDIIERMKQLTAAPTDAALARYLGITPPALVQWRTKNIMPMSYCIEVAERTGASLDYIYLGVPQEGASVASVDQRLLEMVLKRRLAGMGEGLVGLARRVASDYAGVFESAAMKARRSRLSLATASLLVWLADRGGEAEDVAVDPAIVNEAIRSGLLERVTAGTGGAELLVLTPAGQDFARSVAPPP